MAEPNGDSGVREALENAVDEVIPDDAGTQSQETVSEIAPPEGYSDEDKAVWAKIQDPDARNWLLGREKTTSERLKGYETRYAGFDEILAPHEARLKEYGQPPVDVIKNLLTAQEILEDPARKEEGFKWLAQRYGVDLNKLVGTPKVVEEDDALADLDPALKKMLEGLTKEVGEVKGVLTATEQAEQRRIQQSVNEATTSFREAKDKDGKTLLHPFIADPRVSKRMALLIKSGEVPIVGGDLNTAYQKAYDQAVYSFDDLRAKLTPKAAEPDKNRLLSARRAGASVRGVGSSSASPAAKGTLREQLRQAAEQGGFFG